MQETTERIRQLVDGIEAAVGSSNDLELARYLLPPALGTVLAATAAMRSGGWSWLPGRSGLRWSRSERPSERPGCFWLRIRFEDRTEVRGPGRIETAPATGHELELELDTTQVPWRLSRAEDVVSRL